MIALPRDYRMDRNKENRPLPPRGGAIFCFPRERSAQRDGLQSDMLRACSEASLLSNNRKNGALFVN